MAEKTAKEPPETVPGGAGRGPAFIVPQTKEKQLQNADEPVDDPLESPTVPGAKDHGPFI
jgi:hypothetical protein